MAARRWSVYVHVPFCRAPCFHCGCTRVITRDPARGAHYRTPLQREIELQAALLPAPRPIEQLHFGGGTPTFLDDAQLEALLIALESAFGFVQPAAREFSIEIDPRTVEADRLDRLAALGLQRISLGVQDFDPAVQAAVNRVQPAPMTGDLIEAARRLGLRSMSFDLIHGLPRQTPASFQRTLDEVIALRPDRVAIYAYAHLPAMYKAQRQIHAAKLPDAAGRRWPSTPTCGSPVARARQS